MKLAKLYEKMCSSREPFLKRARSIAEITVPQLYPPEGSSSDTEYPTPYQSVGARGVNNLANKVVLSLFPPNQTFFVMDLPETDKRMMGKTDGSVRDDMYSVEKGLLDDMEVSQLRPKLVDVFKQGIVGGSSVLHIPTDSNPEVFSLNEFTIKRDRKGNIITLIIQENISYLTLDKETQEQLKDLVTEKERDGSTDLKVFTGIKRLDKDNFEVYQEIKDVEIEGTRGKYKANDLPYIFIPMVDRGEDYGRSYLEDYIGDLQSYEGLRQSILEASAESARIIYILKAASLIKAKDFETARSGTVLKGNPDDVGTVGVNKSIDMSITSQEAERIKQDLSLTMLLNSAVRRNAERVTAEEVRQVAQELEVAMGGIYSTLGAVAQRPIVYRYMARAVSKNRLPEIIKDVSVIEVTTGAAALGRGTDFQTINAFVGSVQSLLGAEGAAGYLRIPEVLSQIAASLNIKTSDLVKTMEEIQAEQMQAQEQQLAQSVAPEMVRQANQQER